MTRTSNRKNLSPSTVRWLKARTCTGKIPHRSKKAAQIHAKKLRAKGDEVEPYKCAFGKHWHVGHPPKNTPKYRVRKAA